MKATHAKGATPARRLALEITRQVRERDAYAQPFIHARVRTAQLPQIERDFATRLILGVIADSGELDYLIDRALTRGTVWPNVRDALRISAYEMFFLQKEARVAVSQGVELVRGVAPRASGFANKVLREIAKLRDDFPFGDPTVDPKALAHQHAFPQWLANRLIADLGFEVAATFMATSNLPAPIFVVDLVEGATVRIDPSDMSAWLSRVEAGECIITDASVQEIVTRAIEDASVQEIVACATRDAKAPFSSTPFLEVGSGRGTKTVLLQRGFLRALGVQPLLFALDIHAFKQSILEKRVECYRLENVIPVTGDAIRLDELITASRLPAVFGAALIDAPCSGTGTLRRHPEIRWRLAPGDVTAMAKQGLAMLRAVARHIELGGFVLYSTCSVLREENEQVIEAFLSSEEGGAFALETSVTLPNPLRMSLADKAAIKTSEQESAVPNPLRASLAPDSPDAHFAAKLRRRC
jgi:16S rRNA (cytosine967-C5)-methyltransferase